MAPQSPSIQSFFQTKPFKHGLTRTGFPKTPSRSNVGDGFTQEEIAAALHPSQDSGWAPPREYEKVAIDRLVPGPKAISVTGRIANFHDMATPSKRPRAARGCLKLIVKDDTGAVTVRLWYANMAYDLRLGQLVTVWTVHVSNSDHGTFAPSGAALFTSIFPERDRSCHVTFHDHGDEGVLCKLPLGHVPGQQLAKLMTLRNFIDSGYDILDARILVCVKSIGAKKKFTNKKNGTTEVLNVGVFDDTAEATLTLWGALTASAAPWQPSYTVLLITSPGWRISKQANISIIANTQVDVDPAIRDTEWLRSFAQMLTRREHVNPRFPEGVFDVEAAESGLRILYTLADVDNFVRANPKENLTGYLSLLITSTHLATLHRRHMLLSTEHCGVPLYANTTPTPCKQCDRPVPLRINPRVLGRLVDETGATGPGKLVLSDRAWAELLGRSTEELVRCDVDMLRWLDRRMTWVRITVLFGWVGEAAREAGERRLRREEGHMQSVVEGVGRLCVLGVRM